MCFALYECLDQIVVVGGSSGDIRLIQSSECDCLQDVAVLYPSAVTTVVIDNSNLCQQERAVNSVNSSNFPKHSDLWVYSIDSGASTGPDVVALSLTGVLRRPRVALHTSFLMEFVQDEVGDGGAAAGAVWPRRDAVFVLRVGQAADAALRRFMAAHVPAQFLRSQDPAGDPAYAAIFEHLQGRLRLELPLRTALRRRARRTLAAYRLLCPAGANVGLGEKRFGVVDRWNAPVAGGLCVDVGDEDFDLGKLAGAEGRERFRPCCVLWVLLDLNTLDITDAEDFSDLVGAPVAGDGWLAGRMRAEHVWEHLR
jgi:hypothetical protein